MGFEGLGISLNEEEVNGFAEDLDANGDGLVSRMEFSMAVHQRARIAMSNLKPKALALLEASPDGICDDSEAAAAELEAKKKAEMEEEDNDDIRPQTIAWDKLLAVIRGNRAGWKEAVTALFNEFDADGSGSIGKFPSAIANLLRTVSSRFRSTCTEFRL